MSEKDTIEFDVKGLESLVSVLEGKESFHGVVGILGDGEQRDGVKTNAEIGLRHEFGDDKMPQRSFLRVPLIDNLQNKLQESGAFTDEVAKEVIKSGSIKGWVEKATLVAESIVIEAFGTGGFGKWKPSNMKYKKNHQTLVETQQLRDSITSEVRNGD